MPTPRFQIYNFDSRTDGRKLQIVQIFNCSEPLISPNMRAPTGFLYEYIKHLLHAINFTIAL